MNTSYEKEFINSAVKLDALVEAEGRIAQAAKDIVKQSEKEMILALFSEINDIIGKNNSSKEVIILAKHLNECFLKYLGYQRYQDICLEKMGDEKEEKKSLSELLDELEKLVGLEKVKEQVKDLVAFQMVNQRRVSNGLQPSKRTLHLAFIGNPGTGKTTVARIVGRIYKELGLLSKGHFIEASRTDLIAGYQGQTALKVKNLVEKAKGGVLFIDEAYSITENDHSDSYGRECLTELTKALEDYREDLVVIVAGYTEPMRKFFESNPGLESRFNTFIEFDDYTEDQLMKILIGMCKEGDYELDFNTMEEISNYLREVLAGKDDSFSNGRFVRNIYEKMIMNHARRVVDIQNPTIEELSTFDVSDFKMIEKKESTEER